MAGFDQIKSAHSGLVISVKDRYQKKYRCTGPELYSSQYSCMQLGTSFEAKAEAAYSALRPERSLQEVRKMR